MVLVLNLRVVVELISFLHSRHSDLPRQLQGTVRCPSHRILYFENYKMVANRNSNTSSSLQKDTGTISQKQTAKEYCQSCCAFYQSLYSDIQTLSSENLLRNDSSSNVILVDCRTAPERNVSMIEGAISLQDFRNQHFTIPSDTLIVTYCTIGYRSGMEARRLKQQFNLQDRIKSLDGIVSFTHALEQQQMQTNTSTSRQLLDPNTGFPTTNVHCFSHRWACPNEKYTAVTFPFPIFLLRTLQVGLTLVIRSFQSLLHSLGCCCCQKIKVN